YLAPSGMGMTHYENGVINNTTGIYINSSSVYLDNGYNDIYHEDTTHPYYYIYKTNDVRITARNNYWGSTDTAVINDHLYPSSDFWITPICTTSQSQYKEGNPIEYELLQDALEYLYNEEYSNAENTFKSIISSYPETPEAYQSVSGLYACYMESGNNWTAYEYYLQQLRQDTTYQHLEKLLFGYMNLCLRAQGRYNDAIYNYESVLLNDPTYNDSVFAVINIGNTYLEAQNSYKSATGIFSYLRPESTTAHAVKTKKLLLSLHDEEPAIQFVHPQSEHWLGQNFPNPFTTSTSIEIFIAEQSNVRIRIFNTMGVNVNELNPGSLNEGSYRVEFSNPQLKDGLYYYTLEVNGEKIGTKKMIVRK
ncbi:MAG: T9SS type A sorting domain-containing protein, partial [Bacteroidales bacterium]|nr:T9SS type A sorting domain-containing protein [Bacteroidales bacterium]